MFPCHLCDRDYCWRSSLEKHLRVYHGEPQFSCPLCPRIFRHNASLEQHSFSKHNPGFQKFMCDLCGKNYLTKWGLPGTHEYTVTQTTTANQYYEKRAENHIPGMISYRHTNGLTYQKKRHACDKEVFHIKEHSNAVHL